MKKASSHKVNFEAWKQISLNNSFFQRPVKKVEITEKIKFQSIQKFLINAKYFWCSDARQLSEELNAIWEPFEEEDNILMEEVYEKYITNKGPTEINLSNNKFKVNFSVWKQFSIGTQCFEKLLKRQVFFANETDKAEEKSEEKKQAKNYEKKNDENPEYFWRSDQD